jgi:hypothetical protein
MRKYEITYNVLQHIQENYHDVLEPDQIIAISDVIASKWDYGAMAETIEDYVSIYRTDILKQTNEN